MKAAKLNDMKGGWFIGNFEPTLFSTNEFECAVKTYKKGSFEVAHHHKIATEYTIIISGKVKMFEKEWISGDVIIVEPMDSTSFTALEDSATVVVKIPGANDDKYLDV